MSLRQELEAAGLNVSPHSTWETNTNGGRDRIETVGIVNHWDAISGWPGVSKYLSNNRFGGILYHIVISRPGTVHLLSQRYVWHAGVGSGEILNIARAGGTVPDDQPGPDNMNGNPHFFGVCINYHPNDGMVPREQYDALVMVNAVLMDHFNLNVGQVFRHMDWTTRKRDIDTINLAQFRADLQPEEDALLPINAGSNKEDIRLVQKGLGVGATGVWDADTVNAVKGLAVRAGTGDPKGRDGTHVNGLMYHQLIEEISGTDGGLSEAQVKALIADSRIVPR